MSKVIKIQAKELVNPKPNYLSVVAYPASGEAFKIFKSEQGVKKMNQTLKEFLAQKSQYNSYPEMVGLLIHDEKGFIEILKSEHGEVLQAVLSECGFELNKNRVQKSERGGDVILKSESFDVDNDLVDVVRITPEMSVIMKGFDPYRAEMEQSSIFAENMATQGASEGIESAFDIGESTVMAILNEANSPEEAVALISAAMEQQTAYINALVSAIPAKAFQIGQVFGGMRHEVLIGKEDNMLPTNPPKGVDPELWQKMTPEARKKYLEENGLMKESESVQKGFSPHMLPTNPPQGVDPELWKKMTPEARTKYLEENGLMKESEEDSERNLSEVNARLGEIMANQAALSQNVEQIAKQQGIKIAAPAYNTDGFRARKSDWYDDGSRTIDSAFA